MNDGNFGMTHEEREQRFLESRERTVRVIRGEKFVPPTMDELLAAESCRLGVELIPVKVDLRADEATAKRSAGAIVGAK